MKRLKHIALELGILLYLSVILFFVHRAHNQLVCEDIEVSIVDKSGNFFVEARDVVDIVNQKGDQGVGIPLRDINVLDLENEIEKHSSIASAEVFRCIDGKLRIHVTQRRPVVRVVNYNGKGYYIDSEAAMMPLSETYTARVPVATGNLNVPFIKGRTTDVTEDDELGRKSVLADLYTLAKMVDGDEFYSALIEQYYVDADNQFYLIPKMGPKIIEFGTLEHAEEKFFKLTAMYKSGFPLKGWSNYKKINLKFKNQVVCTK